MGLFDGATGTDMGEYSSCGATARSAGFIDCSRLSRSVAAIAHGYRSFDPHVRLVGVVLNRVGSDRHLNYPGRPGTAATTN